VLIDLNADLGEECGDDAALLAIVTTANIAAGGHAGGGSILERTVRLAAEASVSVGAHPSYPDRQDFGRVSRADDYDAEAIATFVAEQVLTVAAACEAQGIELSHVKAHGALYNEAASDEAIALAFLDGVQRAATRLERTAIPVMGLPRSALAALAVGAGVPFQAEAFADRAYESDGTLVPRGHLGAVLPDADAIARQVLQIALEGAVTAIDGTVVPVAAVTICVHGDTPGAVAAARLARSELERHGVAVSASGRSA
jgi:UPF0271 protein